MKAIKYYAEPYFDTWAKTGYLFENGIFLCAFEYYKTPKYICRKYDFQNPPQEITWGKNVVDVRSPDSTSGAISDYQTFLKKETVDLGFDSMKRDLLSKASFWPENHHPSIRLENI